MTVFIYGLLIVLIIFSGYLLYKYIKQGNKYGNEYFFSFTLIFYLISNYGICRLQFSQEILKILINDIFNTLLYFIGIIIGLKPLFRVLAYHTNNKKIGDYYFFDKYYSILSFSLFVILLILYCSIIYFNLIFLSYYISICLFIYCSIVYGFFIFYLKKYKLLTLKRVLKNIFTYIVLFSYIKFIDCLLKLLN
jgi:hypothetical protein